ncbi:sushi domain-containing 1 [Pelobates cultripes]|uniref:Sushi domain-containing 1 n=1 Tax=Pelobates cultripes TaxID=61616 RepID=A0AAD1W4R1_PELCU|nr:sushi domain-containing 1 [Pelobates cultripes]
MNDLQQERDVLHLIKGGFCPCLLLYVLKGRRRQNRRRQKTLMLGGTPNTKVCIMTTQDTDKKLVLFLHISLVVVYCAHTLLASSMDICSLCHANATCTKEMNKYVCKCNYGLFGNGMTSCRDKNECQIGTHHICGNHTVCHNTHGSFFCVCLKGYRPSNDKDNFIPNDGTFCTDIDECTVPSICGNNSLCKNTPGGYECYCNEGFKEQNSRDDIPFPKNNHISSCMDIDECSVSNICGDKSQCVNIPGSFECYCEKGYVLKNGKEPFSANDSSYTCTDVDECAVSDVCGYYGRCKNILGSYECYCKEGYKLQNGTDPWREDHSKALCTAVDCGSPPVLPSSIMDSPYNSTFGSMVTYRCAHGFTVGSGQNTSFCTAEGRWSEVSLVCKVVDCGSPPVLPNSIMDSPYNSTFGSMVTYRCAHGFTADSDQNTSFCTAEGRWAGASLVCKGRVMVIQLIRFSVQQIEVTYDLCVSAAICSNKAQA